MVAESLLQWLIIGQIHQNRHEIGVKRNSMPTFGFAFEIAFESR